MKLIKGFHVTATEKRHIQFLIDNSYIDGRIGRKDYYLNRIEFNVYEVTIVENQTAWCEIIPKKTTNKITVEL